MFHVEQIIKNAFQEHNIAYDKITIEKLQNYTHRIWETNKKFNLTGLTTLEEIAQTLIIQSILPFIYLNVPRGTKFIDMGSGAGIPGIPLCIILPHIFGVLVDSNAKKINFINTMIRELEIANATSICARGEELAKVAQYRERFLFAIARAFADLYITAEICSSFIKIGGFLYIYSNQNYYDKIENVSVRSHIHNLGLSFATHNERIEFGLGQYNTVLVKKMPTPLQFPRRFAAIKREAKKTFKNK